jgi:hypothetical protein
MNNVGRKGHFGGRWSLNTRRELGMMMTMMMFWRGNLEEIGNLEDLGAVG